MKGASEMPTFLSTSTKGVQVELGRFPEKPGDHSLKLVYEPEAGNGVPWNHGRAWATEFQMTADGQIRSRLVALSDAMFASHFLRVAESMAFSTTSNPTGSWLRSKWKRRTGQEPGPMGAWRCW